MFMERLHGGISNATNFFLKNWDEGMIIVGGGSVNVTDELISKVMGISIVSMEFYKDQKLFDAAIEEFLRSRTAGSRRAVLGITLSR